MNKKDLKFLSRLSAYCKQYDLQYGSFQESMWEGEAILEHVMDEMTGDSIEEYRKLLEQFSYGKELPE